MEKLRLLDLTTKTEPCDKCGCSVWIVDAEKYSGPYWLLCIDSKHVGCVNTKPLPENVTIEAE